jgi:ABC-type molybdate transport system ATPase subunit
LKEENIPVEFVAEVNKIKERKYELVVIGNTNVGKSTFLTQITKMKDFFNVSNNRETSCIWRFIVNPNQEEPYKVREIFLKEDTQNMEVESSAPLGKANIEEVKKFIKDHRKPAAQAVAGG